MDNTASPERKCPKCGTPMAADTTEGLCPACLLALNLMTQTQLTGEETGPNGTRKTPPQPKAPPAPEDIAQFFPQFEILQCLGRGGMGVVYKARQKSLDRLVALKILAPEREKDPQFAERFAREAKILAQLSHPNIVTVHDFGETAGMFFLVMEFVDGVNLRHLLKGRMLSPEEALAIVPPVCEALHYAHQQGVIHRDIKPENLLLDKQGRIKIADFGIAKILGRTGSEALPRVRADQQVCPTEVSQAIGTPQYMAPEQTSDPAKVDHRADIYSLGVVLYEMLTGEPPAKQIQPPSQKVQLDVRIDEIVLRALERQPERRYQTAEQFRTQVESMTAAQSRTSSKVEPERAQQILADPDKTRLTYALFVLVGLLIGVVWGYFSDLRNSQVGWFIGRIVFVTLFDVGLAWLYLRLTRPRGEVSSPKPSLNPWPRRVFWLIIALILVPVFLFFVALVVPWLTYVSTQAKMVEVEGAEAATPVAASRLPGEGPEEVLSMSGLRLTESDIAMIASKTRLKRLDLHDSTISDDDLAQLAGLSNLEYVSLYASLGNPPFKPQITDAGLEHIARWKKLKTLNLHGLPITDEGLRHLWYLPELSRLQLGGTRVTGKPLGRIYSLTWLRLDATPIQDEDLRSLAGLSNLEQLYLDITDISDAGLKHLTGLTNLRVLNLHETKVTADGIAFLKKQLPGVAIGWDDGPTDSSSPVAQKQLFGPEKEVAMTEFNNRLGREALDLDNGNLFAQPKDLEQWSEAGLAQWVEQNGIDVFVDQGPKGVWGLMTTTNVELKIAPAAQARWDRISEQELADALAGGPAPLATLQRGILKVYVPPEDAPSLLTCAFHTSGDSRGLLQVLGDSDSPPGVKIRYKLVQPRPTGTASSSTVSDQPTQQLAQARAGTPEDPVVGGATIVAQDGSGDYSTIQAAIDAAPARAVIRISPGHYPEYLTVNKPLTLIGSDWEQTVIGPTEPDQLPSAEDQRVWKSRFENARNDAERRRVQKEFQRTFMSPVLQIQDANFVECFNLKFTQPGTPPEGQLQNRAAVDVVSSQVLLKGCGIVGAPGDGVRIANGAAVSIQDSLIAAVWNTGVRVESSGALCKLRVMDSDIRNCYYAGIVIGSRQNDVTVERCRISGAAWHGIRYDNASPLIQSNVIFDNARSGIYASGRTAAIVHRNLFLRNEMNGISCWYANADQIEENTYADNAREALSILGSSKPTVRRNIFSGHPVAIYQGWIGDTRGSTQLLGTPNVRDNLFWDNSTNWIRAAKTESSSNAVPEVVTFVQDSGNTVADPKFIEPAQRDYSLASDSPARTGNLGAPEPLELVSPWALQPEEQAIIPEGDTRDSRQWKRQR